LFAISALITTGYDKMAKVELSWFTIGLFADVNIRYIRKGPKIAKYTVSSLATQPY